MPEHILKKFGENLKTRRRAKNLTQKQLADKVDYSIAYISLIERGQRNPPLTMVFTLAKAVGVSAADLVS